MSKELIKKSFLAGLGATIASLVLLLISGSSGYVLIMAPFGASCVILFALPESPLAQPKNVICGHFLTGLTGLIALYYLPPSILTTSAAVGVGITIMIITKTAHPPAGANPLLILLSGKSFAWSFLFFPITLGAILLVITAVIFHKMVTKAHYPITPFFKNNNNKSQQKG